MWNVFQLMLLRPLNNRTVLIMHGSKSPARKASLVILSTTFLLSLERLVRANCTGTLDPELNNWKAIGRWRGKALINCQKIFLHILVLGLSYIHPSPLPGSRAKTYKSNARWDESCTINKCAVWTSQPTSRVLLWSVNAAVRIVKSKGVFAAWLIV
jgi:hypothetical protein